MITKHLNLEPKSEAWIDFQDCDPFGHLNNTRYLNYLMAARTSHLKKEYDFDIYRHTAETGNGWVVGTTHISYLAPAHFNETVQIQTRLLHADNLRIVPEAVMTSADGGRIHAVTWVEFIYVNIERGRPERHSAELMAFLRSLVVPGAAWSVEHFTSRVRELQKKMRRRDEPAVA